MQPYYLDKCVAIQRSQNIVLLQVIKYIRRVYVRQRSRKMKIW